MFDALLYSPTRIFFSLSPQYRRKTGTAGPRLSIIDGLTEANRMLDHVLIEDNRLLITVNSMAGVGWPCARGEVVGDGYGLRALPSTTYWSDEHLLSPRDDVCRDSSGAPSVISFAFLRGTLGWTQLLGGLVNCFPG